MTKRRKLDEIYYSFDEDEDERKLDHPHYFSFDEDDEDDEKEDERKLDQPQYFSFDEEDEPSPKKEKKGLFKREKTTNKGRKPTHAPRTTPKKLALVVCAVVITGVVGGWGISNLFKSEGSKPSSIEERLLAPNEDAIKQTDTEPDNDIDQLIEVFPYSRSELGRCLVTLGHTEATAIKAVEGYTKYDEETMAQKRIDIYLQSSGFSSKGLSGRLIADGFEQSKAVNAVKAKSSEIDYAEQAKKRGYSYLEYRVVDSQTMRKALEEDGFTKEDIEKAMKELPCDD